MKRSHRRRTMEIKRSYAIFCLLIFCLSLALTADLVLIRASERILTLQETHRPIARLASRQSDGGLSIAWLMSFPNSGTSFTSRLVRDATQTYSGSNYADETPTGLKEIREAVYDDSPQGPFWIKPEASPEFVAPKSYVLTKTHCGVRCTMCPPEKYAESTYSFRRNCFKTKWLENGRRVFSAYNQTHLSKAVHLVRDPFDNIVSRYHLERQLPGREAAKYPQTREGFREYCAAIDKLHALNEKRALFLQEDILEIMRAVPCHADFFRYIEWHNMAFITTDDLELQEYVLHYDWYTNRFEKTAEELLEFLDMELHPKGTLTPFVPGKIYPYFTEQEKAAVAKAFQIMASPKTWKHVKGYFDKIDTSKRPSLDSLVKEGSDFEILGDVQFLMDFAIVGYPKTATSTKVRWLADQEGIQMYDHELYYLKDAQPADMVRKLYALPEGDYKRGYKAPRDIHNLRALLSFATFWPKTKLIVGLRHPVSWFQSFYNYRVRLNITMPPAETLVGTSCPKGANNVCTEEIRYMDHLSRLGMTDRTDPEELKLLSPILPRHRNVPKLTNPVFLYEISQLHDKNIERTTQYRSDLQNYLGLDKPLTELQETKEPHHERLPGEIDICEERYKLLREELMQIARNTSVWIRQYFLKAPNVYVSQPEYFSQILETWMDDPCDKQSVESAQ